MEVRFFSENEDDTLKTGEKIGKLLKKGMVVTLSGDLGVGKTVMAKGIAKGLGVEARVTSPTFNIVKEYKGREKLCHFDVYRISDPEEMFEIGFGEYIAGGAVCLIEWAEMIEEILPADRLSVNILRTDDEKREIVLAAPEGKHTSVLESLGKADGAEK